MLSWGTVPYHSRNVYVKLMDCVFFDKNKCPTVRMVRCCQSGTWLTLQSTFPVDILAKLCAAEIVKLFGKALRAQDAKHGSKETKTCAFSM
jgi:hypothetical protein